MVVISHVFSLEAADDESELCPRPTVTEVVRDPTFLGGYSVDEKFKMVSWFLLVRGQVVPIVLAPNKALSGLTVHHDPLSCRHNQGDWRLSS
jgi:hypothetical protein